MYEEEPCCTDAPGGEGGSSLSGPLGGSVSSVLGVDAVGLGDGGVSSGAVAGMCLLVGCQVDMTWSCVVLTLCSRLLSVAVCVTLTCCHEAVTRL